MDAPLIGCLFALGAAFAFTALVAALLAPERGRRR